MSLKIGRVGDGIALAETSEWQERADGTVDMFGWMQASSVALAEHLRDQLLGLVGSPDEPIVYVQVGHDDSRNGWYWVLDAEVEHVLGTTELTGARRWRLTVRRTPWWDQPRLELHRSGGVVTNAHSITTSTYTGFIAVPATAEAVDSGTDTGTLSRGARTSDTGALAFITGSGTGAALYNTVVSFDLPGGDVYDGAATIERSVDGTYYPVVGRGVRRENCTDWRLSNGLIRATWDGTNKGIALSVYDGSSWEAVPDSFLLTSDDSHTLVDENPVSWAVLRNDPTMVTIRLVLDFGSGTSRILYDVSLRRGSRSVDCVVKSRTSGKWGLKLSTNRAASALTGGVKRNGDDANGNCFVMSLPKATTDDLATSEVYLTTASQVFPFGLGVELGGAAATGQNTAQNVVYQYHAQAIETPAVSGV